MLGDKKNSIEVLCDGGGEYGYGHIRRSYTLAKALEREKYQVKYTVLSNSKFLVKPEFTSAEVDPVIQVFDLPYEIKPWAERARKKNIKTLALDYFGDERLLLTVSIYEHRIPLPKGRRLSGLEYAIIRPEILDFAPAAIGNSIVVMIGGSDLNRDGERIASQLSDTGRDIYLIQGPGINEDYSAHIPNVTVLKDPKDLESRMANCEWAVTNGGGSMMEMMCLGKAIHVVPQTNDELLLAQIVFNKGAILGIGHDSLSIPSPEKIQKVGKRAQELVDGRGVHRIIRLIDGILSE